MYSDIWAVVYYRAPGSGGTGHGPEDWLVSKVLLKYSLSYVLLGYKLSFVLKWKHRILDTEIIWTVRPTLFYSL